MQLKLDWNALRAKLLAADDSIEWNRLALQAARTLRMKAPRGMARSYWEDRLCDAVEDEYRRVIPGVLEMCDGVDTILRLNDWIDGKADSLRWFRTARDRRDPPQFDLSLPYFAANFIAFVVRGKGLSDEGALKELGLAIAHDARHWEAEEPRIRRFLGECDRELNAQRERKSTTWMEAHGLEVALV